MFAKVLQIRQQVLADRVYSESQSGFRRERSTVDMIFSLRHLQEKCREQRMPLYSAFIDLTKAFDYVSNEGLFKMLDLIGCSKTAQTRYFVHYNGFSLEAFKIRMGVKQRCVLAPTLFSIFFALLLKHAFTKRTEGIYLRTRSDGKLLNRLGAQTKAQDGLIRDALFANDAAFVAYSQEHLQSLMD